MICLWNDKKLARDLKNDAVSQRHKFIYFLMYVIVPFFLSGFTGSDSSQKSEEMLASLQLNHTFSLLFYSIGIGAIAALCWFYKTNQKGDGVHFIERYVCLTVPISIRTGIAGFLAIFVPLMVILLMGKTGAPLLRYLPALPLLVQIYFWIRMNTLFKTASGQMEANA